MGDGAVQDGWKRVGWNGVRLSVPEAWHPAGIEPSCLVFEKDGRPGMTIRWTSTAARGWRRICRHPVGRATLSGMRRGFPPALRRTLRETAVPAHWRDALAGCFSAADMAAAAAFSWGDENDGGEGLVVDCRRTSRRFLIHFHRTDALGGAAEIRRVLASIRTGPEDGRVLWAMFDIQAELPGAFRLLRHRFVPGEFHLLFRARRETVGLFRWGPASVLLRNDSLQDFVARRLSVPRGMFDAAGGESVAWSGRMPSPGGGRRWMAPWKADPRHRGRAWCPPRRNKILAVQAASEAAGGGYPLERLCAAFRTLPADGG